MKKISIFEDMAAAYAGIPGAYEVEVVELDDTLLASAQLSPEIQAALERDKAKALAAQSLASLREALGGDETDIADPSGQTHRISLTKWATANPDKTFLVFKTGFTPHRNLAPREKARVQGRLTDSNPSNPTQ